MIHLIWKNSRAANAAATEPKSAANARLTEQEFKIHYMQSEMVKRMQK